MKKGKTKWIFIGLGGVCAVLVLFLLVLDAYGTKLKRFSSERFGYEVSFDESRYSVETVRLDERPTYMERVVFTKNPYGNYLGVSGIDSTADLDEILAAFQSDGSYQFDIDEDVTIGKGYHARKISYTDTSGEESVRVDYYYMADRGLLIAVAYDKDHEKEIGKILDSFKMK